MLWLEWFAFFQESKVSTKSIEKILDKLRHRGCGKGRIYTLESAALGRVNNLVGCEVKLREGDLEVLADGKIFNDDCSASPEEVISKFYKGIGEKFVHFLEGVLRLPWQMIKNFLRQEIPES
ncbi:MAG: hypothetical protein ACUVQZ_04535 [Candidatus Caldatribacteriaceae bacterium]